MINKWHDLRKDPTDLPEKIGEYYCWCRWDDGDEFRGDVLLFSHIESSSNLQFPAFKNQQFRRFNGDMGFGDYYWIGDTSEVGNIHEVIAWKELDIFEEE